MPTPHLSYGTAPAAPGTGLFAATRPGPPVRATDRVASPLRQDARAGSPVRPRRVVLATLLALHGAAIVALLNTGVARDTARDAKPVFLALVEPPAAKASPPPPPPPPLPSPPALRLPTPHPLALPPIAAEPVPAPPSFEARTSTPAPLATPAQVVEPTATPAPPPELRTLPASAVQYLVPPAPVYSRLSARMKESGTALIRVYIDEAGLPRDVQLAGSTGFARLDEAALLAVRNCRFKPALDGGVPVSGWATVPIQFELPS
jgi:protein TonB